MHNPIFSNCGDRHHLLESSVADQYNIRSIPHCMIYGREGELKESGPDVCWAVVENPSTLLRH